MSHFVNVQQKFGDLKYMRPDEAKLLREFISEHGLADILEIGFYHGKSSAYFAAILEDLGRGHLLTIDLENAHKRTPNIDQVLSTLNLTHRVTPVFAERSYTWELAQLIRATPRPAFDLCYFDGGHTWDATGFGFLLVDMLLRPGGWIIFDDLEWTIEHALVGRTKIPAHWRRCSKDEQASPAVQMVFDLLVPHLGYTNLHTVNAGQWGIAQKPESDAQPANTAADPGWFRKLISNS